MPEGAVIGAEQQLGPRLAPRAPEAFRLRPPAPLGNRPGEGGEDDSEPEPGRDPRLEGEWAPLGRIQPRQQRDEDGDNLGTKITGLRSSFAGLSLRSA